MPERACRSCGAELTETFIDLGMSPLANSYLSADDLMQMERFYPLHAYVCSRCLLVQLSEYVSGEDIFSDYAYFSSYSKSWLEHAARYVRQITPRLKLDEESLVVELASNDGYLLQYFKQANIPVLGVEPAGNVAKVAIEKGIPTRVAFFGVQTARQMVLEGVTADLMVANNVLAHVPALNDFLGGIAIVLKPSGVLTVEFPHLLRLIESNQFDTIYHEHFCYFSLHALEQAFARHGMRIFDVQQLPTHGGSLRIFVCHDGAEFAPQQGLGEARALEQSAGLDKLEGYAGFGPKVQQTKNDLLAFLLDCRRQGKKVVGYGAPAKGNTLLNYCGVRADLLEFTVDLSPHKQGKFLPGTHIPIVAPAAIETASPDYVLILPWNIREEIMQQMAHVRKWGGRFVVPIPRVEVLP